MKNVFLLIAFSIFLSCSTYGYSHVSKKHETKAKIQTANVKYGEDQEFAQQGRTYFDCGNYSAAWAAFNEAIKINPNEQYYYYMRAACTGNLGNHKAALVDYNKALTLAKDNDSKGWIHYDMALMYAKMGDDNNTAHHLITSAKLGHGLAQNFCDQYGLRYS